MGQSTDVISRYDALFAARTGLTLLIPKSAAFDGGIEIPVHFRVSKESPRDVVFEAAERSALVKDLRKEYLDAAIERGVIMLYEMVGEDVVRCTPCSYAGAAK